jgi:hypothetical protein
MDDNQRFTNALLFGVSAGLSFLLGCIVGARTPPTRSNDVFFTAVRDNQIYNIRCKLLDGPGEVFFRNGKEIGTLQYEVIEKVKL